jgi:phospholipid N-methyltransferase
MPHSSHWFDPEMTEIIRSINPVSLLDIGAGAGKYGQIVRQVAPRCHTIAVEMDTEWVESFGLRSLYNEVFNEPADKFVYEHLDSTFEITIFGDVLEHMKKSQGVDLLHALSYNSKHIFVLFPYDFRQGAWRGHESERHISRWTENDFTSFQHKFYRKENIGMVHITNNWVAGSNE